MNKSPVVEFFSSTQTQLLTVSKAYSRYLGSLRRQNRAKRTIETCKQRLDGFVEKYGHIPLEQITADIVDDWLDEFANKGTRYEAHPTRPTEEGELSSTTIGNRIQAICAFFNFCDLRYEGEVNWRRKPTAHLKRPKKSKKRIRHKNQNEVCDEADFQAMLKAAVSARDKAAMAFLGDTAVRAGELVSLQIEDLDLENLVANIVGKTENREVDFAEDAAQLLKAWLAVRPQTKTHNHVFTAIAHTGKTKIGQPLTVHGLYLLCKRLAAIANVEANWNPQAIRRMVGQIWADAGISPERIRLKLGHENIETTLNWYNWQDMESVHETTKLLSPVTGCVADK